MPASIKEPIRYADYKEEMKIRMERYPNQSDLISLFLTAYEKRKQTFYVINQTLQLGLFNRKQELKDVKKITLSQVEEIARRLGSCGYELLESGLMDADHKFFTFLPIRHQPYLDDLFESAFHREIETLQYHIDEFIQESHLDIEELNAIDLGSREITLSTAEKIAQGLYVPAFELIKHEYILYVATKIREYNPHRTFHRLSDLSKADKKSALNYIRYIIQGDGVVTSGEIEFVDRVTPKLGLENLNLEAYKKELFENISLKELRPLSSSVDESWRRLILGLVIESAYSDQMLDVGEAPRLLEIAKLIMTTNE